MHTPSIFYDRDQCERDENSMSICLHSIKMEHPVATHSDEKKHTYTYQISL